MIVSFELSALGSTSWTSYLMRFALGGAVTVAAGLIAKAFGPAIGGLFLAFPALLCAGATLIEKRERKRKAKCGFDGTLRGRRAAALDATGAMPGAIALICFAVVACRALPDHGTAWVLGGAALLWLCVGTALWWLWKRFA